MQKVYQAFDLFMARVTEFMTPDINMALSEDIDIKNAHGVAWVEKEQRVVGIPFVVDRPQNLDRPSQLVLQDMFKQLKKMGHQPKHIELFTASEMRLYKPDQIQPLFVQAF